MNLLSLILGFVWGVTFCLGYAAITGGSLFGLHWTK